MPPPKSTEICLGSRMSRSLFRNEFSLFPGSSVVHVRPGYLYIIYYLFSAAERSKLNSNIECQYKFTHS